MWPVYWVALSRGFFQFYRYGFQLGARLYGPFESPAGDTHCLCLSRSTGRISCGSGQAPRANRYGAGYPRIQKPGGPISDSRCRGIHCRDIRCRDVKYRNSDSRYRTPGIPNSRILSSTVVQLPDAGFIQWPACTCCLGTAVDPGTVIFAVAFGMPLGAICPRRRSNYVNVLSSLRGLLRH